MSPSLIPDLDTPAEIADLVRRFYLRVGKDDLLSPVFVDHAGVDWDAHRQTLTAFWCKVELGLPGFEGAPTQKHSALSATRPFRAEQFARWVWLFHDTIDNRWRGPHAESIKARAVMIAKAQSRMVTNAEPWNGTKGPGAPVHG